MLALVVALSAGVSSAASRKPSSAAAGPSKVTAVNFWSLGELTRVAVEVSAEFKYRSERLNNPDRLVFDVQGARPVMVTRGMHVIAVGDSMVKQIRVAETQPGVTRVVLDLSSANAEFTASQLASPNRLMIEVKLKDRTGPPVGASSTGGQKIKETPSRAVSPDLVAGGLPPFRNSIHPPPAESVTPSAPAPVTKVIDPELLRPQPRRFVPPPERKLPSMPPQPGFSAPASIALQSKAPKPPAMTTALKPDIPPPPVKLAGEADSTSPKLPPFTSLASAAPAPIVTPPSVRTAEMKIPESRSIPESRAGESAPEPAKRNSNGDRSLTRVLGLKLSRVVLDAGHGGYDVGTHGPSGLYEKDLVLDVTKRLGDLLEARLVREVVYTRSTDVFIPLEERPRIANEHKADLFLSIHANSSPIKAAAGTETYYLNFTTSKAALDVAARENASSDRSVFDLKELLQKIALKDKIDESREFAGKVQTSLYGLSSKNAAAAAAAARNRGVKKAPFVVLIGAQMPCALAEIGFLTNPAEEALLRKPEHRQKIAEALYKGIAAYAESLSHPQPSGQPGAGAKSARAADTGQRASREQQ